MQYVDLTLRVDDPNGKPIDVVAFHGLHHEIASQIIGLTAQIDTHASWVVKKAIPREPPPAQLPVVPDAPTPLT